MAFPCRSDEVEERSSLYVGGHGRIWEEGMKGMAGSKCSCVSHCVGIVWDDIRVGSLCSTPPTDEHRYGVPYSCQCGIGVWGSWGWIRTEWGAHDSSEIGGRYLRRLDHGNHIRQSFSTRACAKTVYKAPTCHTCSYLIVMSPGLPHFTTPMTF